MGNDLPQRATRINTRSPAGLLVVLVVLLAGFAHSSPQKSVPAIYLSSITLPGEGNEVVRPLSLRHDHNFHEVFICDSGHARVVVLGTDGIFRFEIAGGDRFSVPMDTAVDSEGFIHVLGSTPEGVQLFRYDFDGLDLGPIALDDSNSNDLFEPTSMAFDSGDNLLVLDRSDESIRVFDRQGAELRTWPLFHDQQPNRLGITGRLTVHNDQVLVPLPGDGVVLVYDLFGRLLDRRGVPGTNQGELNFPVAAESTDDGLFMVLDKHRFSVVCYGRDGRFLGEFGGKGDNPGWFYHPTLLLDIGNNQVLVGQIFRNRIQRLEIPQFIIAALNGATDQTIGKQR